MPINNNLKNLRWLYLSLFIVGLDQISKHFVLQAFQPQEILPLTSFFNLGLWFNPGAAFSFLYNAGGWQRWFFSAIASIVSLILLRWMFQAKDKLTSFSISAILGGALGNLWDRIQLGYVIDFLDFHLTNWHWPAFNIADSAICIGAILLAIQFLFSGKPHVEPSH